MSNPISRASHAHAPSHVQAPEAEGPRRQVAPQKGKSFAAALEGAPAAESSPGIPFGSMIRGAAVSIAGGDQLMHKALGAMRGGRTLSNGELLALQAGVYRYTEELDLAGKLVDKATGAVKQTLQSQQ